MRTGCAKAHVANRCCTLPHIRVDKERTAQIGWLPLCMCPGIHSYGICTLGLIMCIVL